MNVRELAYRSLTRIEKEKRYSSLELDSVISNAELSFEDRAFFTKLLYGVTERRITLDHAISLCSSKPVSRLDLSTIILLRLGIYQMFYLDKIPKSAAVNESVKLASRYSSRSKGFINAVLRKLSTFDQIPLPDKNEDLIQYYSVKYSLPEWICSIFVKDYPEHGEAIFDFANSSPFITIRVNTLKTSVTELLQSPTLKSRAVACTYSPFGIRLTERIPTSELSFDEGLYFVQDEASQIAGAVLDAKPSDKLIDVCSCPGGKAFTAALCMNNQGRINSFDLHESKLSLIRDGASRLGIDIISVSEHDSTNARADLIGTADKVICDVPCSGLGVIAKKSDLRYKDSSTLSDLPLLQYKILCSSASYLKPGGVIVYSTCTLRKSENEEIIDKFLNEHKDFKAVPFKVGDIESNGTLTLFPHVHNTDGFFIAKLMKK